MHPRLAARRTPITEAVSDDQTEALVGRVEAMRLRYRRRAGTPPTEVVLQQRIQTIQLPRGAGSWRIAVMGPKGGSGKTPTAATLGLNLASLRGEITAVVDANTHLGTLRRRLVPEGLEAPLPMLTMANVAGIGQLAPEWPVLTGYSDLVGRLRVFTNAGIDPKRVEDMTGEQYRDFIALLSRAAQLVVSDMGTSTAGEVAVAALHTADQLVVCTELRRDALEMAVEWLSALYGQPVSYRPDPDDYSSIADGRYAELASRAIVVVSPGGGDPVALAPLLNWFAEVTNAGRDGGRVVLVPHDAYVGRGEQILLERLQPATRLAYLQVAAHVVDAFALGRLATRQQPASVAVAAKAANPMLPVSTSPVRPQQLVVASVDDPRERVPTGQVGGAANLALGRNLAGVLTVRHTEGELCIGCTDPACGWPVPAPIGAEKRR
jgi:MinD-like ATPase involved in chromosome partitioning or flagellar assembly